MNGPEQSRPTQGNARKSDLWVGVFVFLLSMYVVHEASRMPDFGSSVESPGMFPAFLGICMAVLSILLAGDYLRFRRIETRAGASGGAGEAPRNTDAMQVSRQHAATVAFVCVLGLIYIYLLPRVHFLWDTLAFLIVLILTLTPGKLTLGKSARGVSVAVVTTLAIKFLFAGAFKLLLP